MHFYSLKNDMITTNRPTAGIHVKCFVYTSTKMYTPF